MIETATAIVLSRDEASDGPTYRRERDRAARIGKQLQIEPPPMDVAPADGVDVLLSVEDANDHQKYKAAQKTAQARGGQVRVKGQPQF